MGETEDYTEDIVLLPHTITHQDGGDDEVNVADLSGELADEQKSAWPKVSGKPSTFPPDLHALTHKLGGSDEIAISGLIFKSACYAYLSTAQDIPDVTVTPVNLDATTLDRNSDFNTTTHRFVCPVAGVYLVLAQIFYLSPLTNKWHWVLIGKNGYDQAEAVVHSSHAYHVSPFTFALLDCAQGDELDMRAHHNRGAAQAIYPAFKDTFFVVLLLYET